MASIMLCLGAQLDLCDCATTSAQPVCSHNEGGCRFICGRFLCEHNCTTGVREQLHNRCAYTARAAHLSTILAN
jgi:hypothetical protein